MELQEWEKVEIRRHHGDTFVLIYKIPLLQNFEIRFELTAVVEERCRTGNVKVVLFKQTIVRIILMARVSCYACSFPANRFPHFTEIRPC